MSSTVVVAAAAISAITAVEAAAAHAAASLQLQQQQPENKINGKLAHHGTWQLEPRPGCVRRKHYNTKRAFGLKLFAGPLKVGLRVWDTNVKRLVKLFKTHGFLTATKLWLRCTPCVRAYTQT